MNPDDLAKILDELGQRLGPAGSRVFELAVRQQIIVNGLWAVTMAITIAVSLTVFIRTFRGMRKLTEVIDALEAKVNTYTAETADIRKKIRDFEDQQEKAKLAAMTDEERASWWTTYAWRSSFPYFSSSYNPNLADLREANRDRIWICLTAGLVAVVAAVLFLIAVPPLLNPEYAAIKEIIGALKP